MNRIKGLQLHESDYADVERQLRDLFKKLIYDPIVKLLAPHNQQVKKAAKELKNSRQLKNAKYDPIVSAINSGRIQYVDGIFSGNFNASISSALKSYGAKWSKVTSTFAIIPEQLPKEILDAAKNYAQAARKLHDALEDKLKNIEMMLSYEIQANPIDAETTINRMDKKFHQEYGDALQISEMSKGTRQKLSRMYDQSLKPFIKKFSQEQVLELRAIVKSNAMSGYRFDTLVDRIENRYNVTKSKAEFLARNETSIYVSKARQVRFGEVGISRYVWRTSNDTDVRDSHRKLRGETFEFSKPPIVDEATGRRANPGEDYNCRCIADPILSDVLEPA